jgi:hypothetical protein
MDFCCSLSLDRPKMKSIYFFEPTLTPMLGPVAQARTYQKYSPRRAAQDHIHGRTINTYRNRQLIKNDTL